MAAVSVPKVVQLKIMLLDMEQPVWRRVQVPDNFTLRRLHDVIQAVMGWFDYHLHQFEIGERIYASPEIAGMDSFGPRRHGDRNVRLGKLLDRGVERFVYIYDFGDDWHHEIEIETVVEPEAGVEYPILVDGRGRCPPEDCGGSPGFEAFLEAMSDENHPDHEELLEWYGKPFDPDDLELETVEAMLGRIRGRRRKGRKRGKWS